VRPPDSLKGNAHLSRDRQRRVRTAYHEAGHAVAALMLGLPLEEVSITMDGEHGLVGGTHCRPRLAHLDPDTHWGRVSPEDAGQLRAAIMVSCAGPLAEARCTGRFTWRCGEGDRETAMEYARYMRHDPAAFQAYLDAIFRQTAELINATRTWPLVEAVAQALLERGRLDGPEARQIVAQARDQGRTAEPSVCSLGG
jgi:ATP-dependent Zn protease